MANLNFPCGQSGLTLYAILQRASDQEFLYADGSVVEVYNAAHWPNYALALTEIGSSGIYDATFPSVAAGSYAWTIRQQAGGSPVVSPATDIQRGLGGGDWNGSLFMNQADVRQLLGTAWLTPGTPGTPDVNARTVADKTGYSLTQSFPTNFASLTVDSSGRVSSNVVAVNNVTVKGAGTVLSPWGPA